MTWLLKAHGAGNDFLVGAGAWAPRLEEDVALVVRLCDRRRGIGADGVLALFVQACDRVRLAYLNADGTRAALCANGVRCAALAAVERLGLSSRLVVATDAGEVPAEVRGDLVAVELPPPSQALEPLALAVGGAVVQGWYGVVGVPHLIVGSSVPLDRLDLARVAPPLRRHPELGPDGANVSFTWPAHDGCLGVRSWERGVEGETLSCGTGVVAAALVHLAAGGGRRVVCRTRGGDELVVEALGEPPACAARLTGPAILVAEVIPTPELTGESPQRPKPPLCAR